MNERIKRARELKKISQKEFAKLLNKKVEDIEAWESGKKIPTIEDLINISNLLEVSIDYLAKGKIIITRTSNKRKGSKEIEKYFQLNNNTDEYIYGSYNNKLVSNKKNERIGNTLIIGSAGSGKSRSIIQPNLIQSIKRENNVIITDDRCELFGVFANMFKEKGYKVILFNPIKDLEQTLGWNILSEFFTDKGKIDEELFEEQSDRLYKLFTMYESDFNPFELSLFKIMIYDAIKRRLNIYEFLNEFELKLSEKTIIEYIKNIDYLRIFYSLGEEKINFIADCLYQRLNSIIIDNLRDVISKSEFKISDIIDQKVACFVEQNGFVADGLQNGIVGLFFDILAYKISKNISCRNIDIYFDEFFMISKHIDNFDILFRDLKEKDEKKISISVFYQNVEQIKYALKDFNINNINEFFDLFETVICLGVCSMESMYKIADYMGLKQDTNPCINDIRLMKMSELLICRNNKTVMIDKNCIGKLTYDFVRPKECKKFF